MRIIISAIFFVVGILLFFFAAGYNMIGLCFVGAAILLFISRFGRRGHRLIAIMLAVFVPTLIGLEIPILRAARTDAPDTTDYIIVLGAGVNGTTPSLSLLDRLETATSFLKAHPSCRAVVSGGQGPGEEVAEASVMREYLLRQGIAEDRILLEDMATSTEENLRFSFALIEKETTDPVVAVVSSEYHLYRAKYIAEKLGYTVFGVASPTSNLLIKINYFLREAPAMIKAYLLD